MTTTQRPILLFSEGISHCHVVRPLIIGRWLRSLKVPIKVACNKNHRDIFRADGFDVIEDELYIADPVDVYGRIMQGKTLYVEEELTRYFVDDERLLDQINPLAVVSDFRFPLQQLAKKRSIPSITITSASCHPNFDISGTTPDVFLVPFIPPAFLDFLQKTPIGKAKRKSLIAQLSVAYQIASRKAGVEILDSFFEYASQGDLCLMSDHPKVMPIKSLRPQDLYTGSLIWERNDPLPDEIAEIKPDASLVYVTVGTQNSLDTLFLENLIHCLVGAGKTVILSKGKREFNIDFCHERFYQIDYINDTKLMPKVSLYIYHGSAMSTYLGLYFGKPMIAIPAQPDQHFHSEALIRLGVGTFHRPSRLSNSRLAKDVERLLLDETVARKCDDISKALKAYDQQAEVVARVESLIQ